MKNPRTKRILLACGLAAGILFLALLCFYHLDYGELMDWDEARHGVSAYEMLQTGEPIVTTYAYSPDYWNLKPPLSEWLIVQVHKNGKIYEMRFARGEITQKMKVVGDTDRTGTTVTFKPDPEMFEDTEYNYDTLHTRMREEAFLNAGLRIRTVDKRPGQEQEDNMCFEGGIREFVTWLNKSKDPLHPQVV